MRYFKSPISFGLLIAALTCATDQLSKIYLLNVLGLPERGLVEILPFFNLVAVWNRGVSFGMLSGHDEWRKLLLIAIAGVIILVLYGWLKRANSRWLQTALGFVIGGAIGNIIDRLRLGAVFDFLDVHAFGYHWPAFNVADSAICIGVFILCLDSLFSQKPTPLH